MSQSVFLLSFNSKFTVIDHTPTASHHDLGVIFSSDLSWNNHYKFITSKAYKHLDCYVVRTFSYTSSTSVKKLLYIYGYLLVRID